MMLRITPTTVARKPGSPGRSRISRKTIAQGRPVAPAEPVVLPRAFLLHADHGCSPHPAFPAPSFCDEGGLLEKLGRIAPRECDLTPPPLSCPASSGAPSIPEAYRLCTNVSGILGRPVKPGDDSGESVGWAKPPGRANARPMTGSACPPFRAPIE